MRRTNDRLRAVLGDKPHMPPDEAVQAMLQGLGCLPDSADKVRTAAVTTPPETPQSPARLPA